MKAIIILLMIYGMFVAGLAAALVYTATECSPFYALSVFAVGVVVVPALAWRLGKAVDRCG